MELTLYIHSPAFVRDSAYWLYPRKNHQHHQLNIQNSNQFQVLVMDAWISFSFGISEERERYFLHFSSNDSPGKRDSDGRVRFDRVASFKYFRIIVELLRSIRVVVEGGFTKWSVSSG